MLKKLFRKERRRQYRVPPGETYRYSVELRTGEDEWLAGTPIDLSLNGTAASFPAENSPELREGDSVTLRITITESGSRTETEAIIRHAGDRDEEQPRTCHFQFLDMESFSATLSPDERNYFNRRQSFRVSPIEVGKIPVTIGWDGNTATGWIVDLSVTGMGLGVEPAEARRLGEPERIRLRFTLPGRDSELFLPAAVQFRKERGGHFLYGLRFELDAFGEDRQKEAAISAFLVKQQQILLQKRAHALYED